MPQIYSIMQSIIFNQFIVSFEIVHSNIKAI